MSLGTAIDSRSNNFNALRLLAASLVIIEHIQVIWFSHSHKLPTLGELNHSSFALFMFFFVSGVLISESVANSRSLLIYIAARVLRLYPALILTAAVCFFIIGPLAAEGPYWSEAGAYLYPLNVLIFADTEGGPPGFFPNNPAAFEYNPPLWTLRYEAVLYASAAAFPALGFIKRAYIIHAMTLGAALTLIITNAPIDPVLGSYTLGWMTAFGFCFLLGTSVWLLRDKIYGKLVYLLAAVGGFAIAAYAGIGASLMAVLLVAAFVLWAGITPPLPVVKRHDVSYGVYIWHYPIGQVLMGMGLFSSIWLLGITTFLLTLLIATASWLYIERPAMRLKKRLQT